MNFKDWISNPSGKGSSVMTSRGMYREMYVKKLDIIMLRENNNFTYHLYRSNNEYKYYIHMNIPSEVIPKFYYDVVIEFSTVNPAYAASTTLNNYDIRVFSNSPDFIFTHAHAYNKAKLFFTDLKDRVPEICLKEVAKEKNPKDEIGYVKSLYFAYLIMTQRNLFDKVNYKTALKYNKKSILDTVMQAERKINLRKEEEHKLHEENKKKKALEAHNDRVEARSPSNNSKNVMKSAMIKATKGVKSSKMVKRTKKI